MTRREAQGDPVLDRRLRLPCFVVRNPPLACPLARKRWRLLKYPGTIQGERDEIRGDATGTRRIGDWLLCGDPASARPGLDGRAFYETRQERANAGLQSYTRPR